MNEFVNYMAKIISYDDLRIDSQNTDFKMPR